ncbi:urea ABC transporter ATP-binding subunit UrtE [Methyloprofundus sedimenti]|uniref:Urea ABC transporter ATP-binding subunit UrtE n=1 Tax=Methyloprofundus sedimenti TaxID=1420851 RepID=A0A1V8M1U0_9GAMM|nr:ABC transporter ATP-binding protein [Methyloprofundus sedimenti]OQK15529.1 urea ABC transporter ATP-binding subunit UrtE [Methyloprofundus sedimenti]
MLNISSLNQYYGGSHTLWDLELDVPEGECVCLMGRNGVGKTTLLKSIMGLVPVRGGSIMMQGQSIAGMKAEIRAELGIGFVPQGREIFSLLTVEENLKTGLRAASKLGIKKIPEHIYDMFPVLKQMRNRRGGDLSGGQQQQLAIGRALVLNPKLLILDEPTEGIQPNIVSDIGDVIMRLNRSKGIAPPKIAAAKAEVHEAIGRINRELGVTVLLVEQKLPFARKVATQFCIMERGRHVATGAMSELSDDLVKQYLTV